MGGGGGGGGTEDIFWLCEIFALLGQNGGKEIMAHINFGSPRV